MNRINNKKIKIACEAADYLPAKTLKDFQGELKKISKANLQKLKNNIIKYGFSAPIFVWKNGGINYILDGHGRVKAVLALIKDGYAVPSLPVAWIKARSKTEAKKKLLQIASQYGEMTVKGLELFLEDADIDLGEIGIDLELPGIEIRYPEEETADDDLIPEKVKAITRLGDLWELNGHRVLCGDSTEIKQVERLMVGQKADMVFTDPPYGINIVKKNKVGTTSKMGFVGVKDVATARKYKPIIGDNKSFNPQFILELSNKIILWGANNYASKLPDNSRWLVWDKKDGKEGLDHNNFSDCELAWTNFKNKSIRIYRHLWSGLLRQGERTDELKQRVHPTQKPVGLCVEIISDFSKIKNILIDPFLGSGSTLIACEKTERTCYGMEIESHYVDITVRRWIDWCKKNERKYKIKRNGKLFKQ